MEATGQLGADLGSSGTGSMQPLDVITWMNAVAESHQGTVMPRLQACLNTLQEFATLCLQAKVRAETLAFQAIQPNLSCPLAFMAVHGQQSLMQAPEIFMLHVVQGGHCMLDRHLALAAFPSCLGCAKTDVESLLISSCRGCITGQQGR